MYNQYELGFLLTPRGQVLTSDLMLARGAIQEPRQMTPRQTKSHSETSIDIALIKIWVSKTQYRICTSMRTDWCGLPEGLITYVKSSAYESKPDKPSSIRVVTVTRWSSWGDFNGTHTTIHGRVNGRTCFGRPLPQPPYHLKGYQ